MLRFKAYVLDKNGQIVPFDVPNNMMKGSQLKEENELFDKLHKLNEFAISSQQPKSAY